MNTVSFRVSVFHGPNPLLDKNQAFSLQFCDFLPIKRECWNIFHSKTNGFSLLCIKRDCFKNSLVLQHGFIKRDCFKTVLFYNMAGGPLIKQDTLQQTQQNITMDTIDTYNRHLQQNLQWTLTIDTIDTYNRHLQWTLTIDTYNIHHTHQGTF